MAIQENDILSGRPLIMSFPDKFTFEDDGTVASSDKYTIDAENDGETAKVVLKTMEDVLIATLYSYDIDTDTTTINIATYTLPNDFGIVNDIDAEVDAYQYITAIMGTPIASDTLDMSTYGQAAKVATNYMTWSSQYGLVISEDATEDPEEMTGGSTRVTFDGVEMYRGQKRVAKFGEKNIIGEEDGANAYIDPDTFHITSSYGVQFFSVDMDGDQRQMVVVSYFSHFWDVDFLPVLQVAPNELDRIPSGTAITLNIGTDVGGGSFRPVFNVVKGTEYSGDYALVSDIYLHLDYDGKNTYEFSLSESLEAGHFGVEFRTDPINVDSPSYTIGTRESGSNGAFSVAIGEGLIADYENQIVLGKYNECDSNNLVEVGYGTASTPKTIVAIDKSGNIKANNQPTMMECGQITVSNVASHSYADYQVTFSKAFSSAPIVVVGMMTASTGYGTGSVSVSAHTITKNGFTARVFNNDSTARSPYIHWIAMLA